MEQDKKINKMGTMPVPRLMLSMGIPMILSMMLQAFYNIVDSAFVSNMAQDGEAALTALTLAFPVQMLLVALGVGTGVGANALLSRTLGEGNREKVNRVAGNAEFLSFVICIVSIVFGIIGVRAYVQSQSNNTLVIDMAISYLRICCCIPFGMVFFSCFEKLLQATGKSLLSTIAQVAGAVTNIILDPILIYGLLGCPAFGVRGAAYATVIGQIVSCVVALAFHLAVNTEIANGLCYIKPSKRLIQQIYAIGLPAIIAQALMSVMTYGLNLILGNVSENAVTAYGLYYKIQQFLLFAAFGLRDAITPIISFNYGMRDKQRVNTGIKYGMLYTLLIMLFGTLALELFASPLASIFGLSGETEQLCIYATRIISLSLIFAGVNVAFQGIFQALRGGMESLVISLCRQLLFVLPVAWLLARLGLHVNMPSLVWWTFLFAEVVSAVISCIFMRRIRKTKIASIA